MSPGPHGTLPWDGVGPPRLLRVADDPVQLEVDHDRLEAGAGHDAVQWLGGARVLRGRAGGRRWRPGPTWAMDSSRSPDRLRARPLTTWITLSRSPWWCATVRRPAGWRLCRPQAPVTPVGRRPRRHGAGPASALSGRAGRRPGRPARPESASPRRRACSEQDRSPGTPSSRGGSGSGPRTRSAAAAVHAGVALARGRAVVLRSSAVRSAAPAAGVIRRPPGTDGHPVRQVPPAARPAPPAAACPARPPGTGGSRPRRHPRARRAPSARGAHRAAAAPYRCCQPRASGCPVSAAESSRSAAAHPSTFGAAKEVAFAQLRSAENEPAPCDVPTRPASSRDQESPGSTGRLETSVRMPSRRTSPASAGRTRWSPASSGCAWSPKRRKPGAVRHGAELVRREPHRVARPGDLVMSHLEEGSCHEGRAPSAGDLRGLARGVRGRGVVRCRQDPLGLVQMEVTGTTVVAAAVEVPHPVRRVAVLLDLVDEQTGANGVDRPAGTLTKSPALTGRRSRRSSHLPSSTSALSSSRVAAR